MANHEITLKDVYDIVLELKQTNARERLDDHELRIRSLERQLVWWSGAAAGIGAIIGSVLSLFMKG
jgi:hypothetical protein